MEDLILSLKLLNESFKEDIEENDKKINKLIIKYNDFNIIQQCFELFDIYNIIFQYINNEKTIFNFILVKKEFYILYKDKLLKNKITEIFIPQYFIKQFVDKNILYNQTDIVQYFIEDGSIDWEIDIMEQYRENKKYNEKYNGKYNEKYNKNNIKNEENSESDIEVEEEYPEIYSWYLLSDNYIYRKLKEENEIVIYHLSNYWWGRQCWGQSITLDYSIKNICRKIYHN
jgi:hypothetical protein